MGVWEGLSDDDEKEFLRAIKFYNRGLNEFDKIDKFINFFIAFEIIGKSLASNENAWINEISSKFNVKYHYEEFPLSQIRAAIIHRKNKSMDWHKAVEIVEKYVDAFGQDVSKLINIYLEKTPLT